MGQVHVTVNNRQAIAVFILGIAFLLAAFWAGLNVVKRDAIGPIHQPDNPARPGQATRPAGQEGSAQATVEPPGDAGYILQVAGFGTADKANQLVADLRRKYKSAHVQAPSGDDTIYRVLIGPYPTRAETDQVAGELAAQGMKGVMILSWPQH
ncbi:MAG TPA: SPOR domain-containing protein [Blastocatellia bacterium]|jgi:cell division septation protein DedD|nr:SPOR domain-containing protein [Blastocatellia bacterium]